MMRNKSELEYQATLERAQKYFADKQQAVHEAVAIALKDHSEHADIIYGYIYSRVIAVSCKDAKSINNGFKELLNYLEKPEKNQKNNRNGFYNGLQNYIQTLPVFANVKLDPQTSKQWFEELEKESSRKINLLRQLVIYYHDLALMKFKSQQLMPTGNIEKLISEDESTVFKGIQNLNGELITIKERESDYYNKMTAPRSNPSNNQNEPPLLPAKITLIENAIEKKEHSVLFRELLQGSLENFSVTQLIQSRVKKAQKTFDSLPSLASLRHTFEEYKLLLALYQQEKQQEKKNNHELNEIAKTCAFKHKELKSLFSEAKNAIEESGKSKKQVLQGIEELQKLNADNKLDQHQLALRTEKEKGYLIPSLINSEVPCYPTELQEAIDVYDRLQKSIDVLQFARLKFKSSMEKTQLGRIESVANNVSEQVDDFNKEFAIFLQMFNNDVQSLKMIVDEQYSHRFVKSAPSWENICSSADLLLTEKDLSAAYEAFYQLKQNGVLAVAKNYAIDQAKNIIEEQDKSILNSCNSDISKLIENIEKIRLSLGEKINNYKQILIEQERDYWKGVVGKEKQKANDELAGLKKKAEAFSTKEMQNEFKQLEKSFVNVEIPKVSRERSNSDSNLSASANRSKKEDDQNKKNNGNDIPSSPPSPSSPPVKKPRRSSRFENIAKGILIGAGIGLGIAIVGAVVGTILFFTWPAVAPALVITVGAIATKLAVSTTIAAGIFGVGLVVAPTVVCSIGGGVAGACMGNDASVDDDDKTLLLPNKSTQGKLGTVFGHDANNSRPSLSSVKSNSAPSSPAPQRLFEGNLKTSRIQHGNEERKSFNLRNSNH